MNRFFFFLFKLLTDNRLRTVVLRETPALLSILFEDALVALHRALIN